MKMLDPARWLAIIGPDVPPPRHRTMSPFRACLSRSTQPAALVCAECHRADRDGDGRGWKADWAGGQDGEGPELVDRNPVIGVDRPRP
jgi:hypothetical protein